jgi:hypothetical protein
VDLVVIYGPPGVGKLTTAKELSRLTGYKLFDNHASIDVVRRVFDFGDAPFWDLVLRLRFDVIDQAAKHGVSVVTTFVYVHPEDIAYVAKMEGFVEGNGGRILYAGLRCTREVLEQRVQSEGRAATGKLTSLPTLKEMQGDRDIFAPIPERESLIIDNTNLQPEESARRIIAHYGLQILDGN